ncbi:2-dehydropantoate 2-reductase [Naumannella huperziae]
MDLANGDRGPRVAVHGLGAIGGLFAARLARAGAAVSGIGRGANLEAIRRDGVRLIEAEDQPVTAYPITVTEDPAELGPQDIVIIAVKAAGLGDVAAGLPALLGPQTTVVSAMNGVPWWFFARRARPPAALPSLDPHGLGDLVDPDRVLGAVVHLSASRPEPGLISRTADNRLVIGRPGAAADDPLTAHTAELFARAGFATERSDSIEQEIWFKLWGNLTMNPLSAITGSTVDLLLDDPAVRGFATACMREAAAVGAAMGIEIDTDPEQRHTLTRRLGAVRTSMLQDVEAGRPVELDSLVTIVTEIASAYSVPTPNIDLLHGLARAHARAHGLVA